MIQYDLFILNHTLLYKSLAYFTRYKNLACFINLNPERISLNNLQEPYYMALLIYHANEFINQIFQKVKIMTKSERTNWIINID
ncbi:MAG TPA: hypothetical protein DEP23_05115 [Ruminococcaceae bacterium]|nr:hypothetical protein [Oscillospiraceae bacterium]